MFPRRTTKRVRRLASFAVPNHPRPPLCDEVLHAVNSRQSARTTGAGALPSGGVLDCAAWHCPHPRGRSRGHRRRQCDRDVEDLERAGRQHQQRLDPELRRVRRSRPRHLQLLPQAAWPESITVPTDAGQFQPQPLSPRSITPRAPPTQCLGLMLGGRPNVADAPGDEAPVR